MADNETVLSDGAENGPNGWEVSGFSAMTGTTTSTVPHYHLAENRHYVDYDANLRTGPYNRLNQPG